MKLPRYNLGLIPTNTPQSPKTYNKIKMSTQLSNTLDVLNKTDNQKKKNKTKQTCLRNIKAHPPSASPVSKYKRIEYI